DRLKFGHIYFALADLEIALDRESFILEYLCVDFGDNLDGIICLGANHNGVAVGLGVVVLTWIRICATCGEQQGCGSNASQRSQYGAGVQWVTRAHQPLSYVSALCSAINNRR